MLARDTLDLQRIPYGWRHPTTGRWSDGMPRKGEPTEWRYGWEGRDYGTTESLDDALAYVRGEKDFCCSCLELTEPFGDEYECEGCAAAERETLPAPEPVVTTTN